MASYDELMITLEQADRLVRGNTLLLLEADRPGIARGKRPGQRVTLKPVGGADLDGVIVEAGLVGIRVAELTGGE